MNQDNRDKLFKALKDVKDVAVNAAFDKSISFSDSVAKNKKYDEVKREQAREFGDELRNRKVEYNLYDSEYDDEEDFNLEDECAEEVKPVIKKTDFYVDEYEEKIRKQIEARLKRCEQRKNKHCVKQTHSNNGMKFKLWGEHCNIITLGHLDHVKTTLTAAITKTLHERLGIGETVAFESIDEAPEDRTRGILVFSSYIEYKTKHRYYTHVDCPSHADYVKT